MAGGQWNVNNYPAVTTAASASKTAASSTGPDVLRCRSLSVSVAGDGAVATGKIKAVLRDGATGVGTIIWSATLQAPATGSANIDIPDLDYRASIGNALTLETTSAPAGTGQAACSMAGDVVVNGYVVGSN
jgi:hypothetical protein